MWRDKYWYYLFQSTSADKIFGEKGFYYLELLENFYNTTKKLWLKKKNKSFLTKMMYLKQPRGKTLRPAFCFLDLYVLTQCHH